MKERISVDEIAQVLGYHKVYVYFLLKNGKIPSRKILGRVVVYRNEFEQWVDSQENTNG